MLMCSRSRVVCGRHTLCIVFTRLKFKVWTVGAKLECVYSVGFGSSWFPQSYPYTFLDLEAPVISFFSWVLIRTCDNYLQAQGGSGDFV